MEFKRKYAWPPVILFEAIYASAMVHQFGVRSGGWKGAFEKWDRLFYKDGPTTAGRRDVEPQRRHVEENKMTQSGKREKRHDEHSVGIPPAFFRECGILTTLLVKKDRGKGVGKMKRTRSVMVHSELGRRVLCSCRWTTATSDDSQVCFTNQVYFYLID